MAQRLKEGALRVALSLKLPLPANEGGGTVVGCSALARPAVPAQFDQMANVLQPAIRSGAAELIHRIEQRYGLDQQDRVVSSLDGFFDFRRGPISRQEDLNEFEVRWNDAETQAGLQINNVGKNHLPLKYSGISETKPDEIRLHMNGDTK